MLTEIPRETLHEILRKLTPAIGRVLAERRPLNDDHDILDCCRQECSDCTEHACTVAHNSALEQVLDPEIVEAVVREEAEDETVEVNGYVPYLYSGNGCILGIATDDFMKHVGEVKKSDLPALVAEAWEV